MTVRTRFAPSPTGTMHVGNVRTALFAWLFARHAGGKFVLRIEDTDLERSLAEHTENLMRDLDWLGLDWDEGPRVGGPHGPYLQSERLALYREYAERLVREGRAYRCYCTPAELEKAKLKLEAEGHQGHYDGRCRNLNEKECGQLESEGRTAAIRFVAYDEDFSINDTVKGLVTFPRGMVGDFIIMRSNGLPVYNYAVTLDDALMEITHVLRADEHLSNTVRQLMIYRAFGFPAPAFAHMALVLGPDRQKLSKRHGATSIDEFRDLGYLPEGLLNYLALLGWSHPDEKEVLTRDELVAAFTLDRLSASPAVFDVQKLDWMAKHYVAQADLDRIYELALPYLKETGMVDDAYLASEENRRFLRGMVALTRGYCAHLSQIKEHVGYFLSDDFAYDDEAREILAKPESAKVIVSFAARLEAETRTLDDAVYKELMAAVQQEAGVKGKALYMPIRAAITGKVRGPETHSVIPLIGRERTLKRLVRPAPLP